MRKIFTLAAFLFATLCSAVAQEPTTTWPYLYPDFQSGRIVMDKGQVAEQRLNIHLAHSKLHFLENEIIKEAVMGHIVLVQIGDDSFIPYEGEMMRVEVKRENGLVASKTVGNFTALAETGGAYGTSSATSATMSLSSVDADSSLGRNHMLILQEKEKGQELPVLKKYYVVTKEFTCPADKKSLTRQFADRADEWKTFLKTSKIQWKNAESLALILDFIK